MDIGGKFFPVGHGLTYAFKINNVSGAKDLHVLYDIRKACDMKELEKFYGNKIIDFLILSHLHTDHIDGVGKLCNAGFRVKKIYIPYLNNDEKIFVELKWRFRTGVYRSYNEIINQIRSILENIEVIEVDEWEREYASITIEGKLWEFNIFQNKGNSASVVNDIRMRLQSMRIYGNHIQYMLRKKERVTQIRDAYNESMRKYNSNLNETSIFLEHGPLTDKIKVTDITGYGFFMGKFEREGGIRTHSLITGDMSLNEVNNKGIISNFYNKLGVVLVPHHSGVREWSTCVCQNIKPAAWVVTISGIGIRPYGKVVKDVYNSGHSLYICDNKYSFEYSYG